MNQPTSAPKKVYTGAEIITVAETGVVFATVSEPTILIKRNEEGTFISVNSGKNVTINNKFLNTKFVLHEEEQTEVEYLSLEDALEAFSNGKHVHVTVTLPNGQVHESICLNKFLPIGQVMDDLQEEGMFEVLKFIASFKKSLDAKEEDALELINPLNAAIPVEILIHGKFFIESEENDQLLF